MLVKMLKPVAVAAAAAVFLSGPVLSPAYAAVTESAPATTQAASSLPDFVTLVQKYGPGVVNISTVREARVVNVPNPFGMDDRQAEILKRFGFPIMPFSGQAEEPEQRGTGSGFIISADGLILTNHHVVQGADEITVKLTDGREFKGKVLGSDAKTDIAVVRINAKDLPVLKMGNSDNLKVGEWVAAIGSPFGLDNSVTAGIVSATSRKLPAETYVPFIQTDVAVNPGNSGGPLFNLKGEVVGINSQIFSTSGGYMGLSFAIPINLALQIKDQLVKTGKVTRGMIGVIIQSVTPELAESFGMQKPEGAIVSEIMKDGPAAKSGLKVGDVIVGVDGKDVKSSADMPMIISAMAPGSTAKLSVLRDGKTQTISVKVEESSSDMTSAGKGSMNTARLGVTVRPLSDKEAQDADTQGLLVVKSEGAASKAGIRPGDILINVNGVEMTKSADLGKVLSSSKSLRILVQRGDARIFIPVRLK